MKVRTEEPMMVAECAASLILDKSTAALHALHGSSQISIHDDVIPLKFVPVV